MKKIILMLAIAAFMASNIGAQENNRMQGSSEDNRDKLLFGLKVGLNYSNVYDVQGEEFEADAKFGFAAGAFLSIPIGMYLGIQPEVLFSQKGFQATGSFLGSNYKYTRTLNYIDVPLLVQVKPSAMVTLLAGPQFSFLVKQKDVIANLEVEQDFENDNLRKNVLSVAVGMDINPNPIVFGLRACWDLQHNNGDGTSTIPRYRNVWYQASIGLRF